MSVSDRLRADNGITFTIGINTSGEMTIVTFSHTDPFTDETYSSDSWTDETYSSDSWDDESYD